MRVLLERDPDPFYGPFKFVEIKYITLAGIDR